ncbi:MAG: aminotransferase class IV family protein [Gemmobacter sp.]
MEKPFRLPVPAGTRLIETFGWHPGEGVRHLPRHLARLSRSASRLGFRYDPQAVARAVAGIAGTGPLRCRLTLAAGGEVELTCTPLGPTPSRWRVMLAQERLDPADDWLSLKSTQRAAHDRARAALPPGVDEALFLNGRGECCEGTITSLFVLTETGERLTPARGCGLLPGVLREVLLDEGWAEAVLHPADLRRARAVWVGNSLRGLIPAELVGDPVP